jgi:sugar diacid utilization regulator
MPSALQRLVDGLSRRIKCAVVIDDTKAQQQVYNTQFGSMDQSRRNRILSRTADQEVSSYFLNYREPWPEWPVRVPAKPEIGVESRVYMAIQHQNELLGHLWVFDKEYRVKEDDFDLVFTTSESAALIMSRQQLLSDLERSRERELLRDLLAPDKALRARAADDLIAFELFEPGAPVQALVVKPLHPEAAEPEQSVRQQIGQALEQVRAGLTPGFVLSLVLHDHGVLLVSPLDPAVRSKSLLKIAEELQEELATYLKGDPGSEWQVFTGVGDEERGLADAIETYEHAHHGVRVASISGSFGPVTAWSRLGTYRILSQLPVEQLAPQALHSAVLKLAGDEDARGLLETLETYLDLACDAKATAAELFVHRATLYYRLKRIADLTGADMTSGDERLAIHLSLKLGRLIGLFGRGTGTLLATPVSTLRQRSWPMEE